MPERAAARNDGRLVQRIGGRHVERHDGVAGLVIGGEFLFGLGHGRRPALGAHHHLVLGVLELLHGDKALVAPRRHQRRLVDEVHQVGAGEARRAARHDLEVDIRRQRHIAHMHLQDLLAAVDVRIGHHDLPVEAARTQQRRVEHVGAVGSRDKDDALVGFEAVHFDEQLVQRLLALVIAAAQAGAAMAADRVDFVDEDDAGRVLLGLVEHVADTACADADEHLDEIRTGNGEERHVGLASDRARQQRLAGAGRADEQHAARNLAAEPLEFLRIAQEFDDFLEILLGLVDTGHVLEGDAAVRFGEQLGLRLAEAHRPSGARLHLAHEEDPDAEDKDHRQPGQQHRDDGPRTVILGTGGDRHALLLKARDQGGVARRVGLKARGIVRKGAGNAVADDGDGLDAARTTDRAGTPNRRRPWSLRGTAAPGKD